MRPERRRRADFVVAALVTVAVVLAVVLLWRFSPAAATVSRTAPAATAPPAPDALPQSLAEVWRAPSPATPVPVAVGPAVVTGDGGDVAGRDPLTGAVHWLYSRDLPLCTVGSGFEDALAVYRKGEWCSEVTALDPATGARGPQRNSEARPGTRLLAAGGLVAATGHDYLEVWRSDLVTTLEYGALPTPAQPGRQPHTGCRYGSVAVAPGRVGMLERCPGEGSDRLTVLRSEGADADRPEQVFSTLLGVSGGQLVAISESREAVLLPGPPRLELLDGDGSHPVTSALPLPPSDAPVDPPSQASPVTVTPAGLYWWTGSSTVALDPADLHLRWTVAGTLGPGAPFVGRVLLPVPAGLAVVDPDSGTRLGLLSTDRGGYRGPVGVATLGPVVLEQRGATLVALR